MAVECEYLLIADRVIREDNGKFGVIGIFRNITIPEFPATAAPWHIFAHISGIPPSGIMSITVNIYNKDTGDVVFTQNFDFEPEQIKGADLDFNLQVTNVLFQKPGAYAVTVSIDGASLRTMLFNVQATGGAE